MALGLSVNHFRHWTRSQSVNQLKYWIRP